MHVLVLIIQCLVVWLNHSKNIKYTIEVHIIKVKYRNGLPGKEGTTTNLQCRAHNKKGAFYKSFSVYLPGILKVVFLWKEADIRILIIMVNIFVNCV